jgi:hypothetical protein
MSEDDDTFSPDGVKPGDAAQLLRDAREKARILIERLVREQAEIEANPPAISPEALTEGRTAMARAVAAARRTLEAIDAAIATSPDPDASDPASLDEDVSKRWN